jgi:hypothetical protein
MTDSMGHSDSSPFESLASAYDAWFEGEGKLIFAIEVRAFQEVLPLLPRPWLEVGVGSGRFAQALGIETGIDPSLKLLEMARRRGITGFLARGEEQFFDEDTFGTVFLIRDSPWGQLYLAKKEEGHPLYKCATFYSYEEVTELLQRAGFAVETVLSTLFQRPGEVEGMEMPQEGFSPDAGFTVVLAFKRRSLR